MTDYREFFECSVTAQGLHEALFAVLFTATLILGCMIPFAVIGALS